MQIVHDSSGKKKPMQVVDDGKEIKLKKFDKLDIPEQEEQDNSDIEAVTDDTQVEHSYKPEDTPTETESVVEKEQDETKEEVAKEDDKKSNRYQNRINELVKRANQAERQRNDFYNRIQQLEEEVKKKNVVSQDYASLQTQYYDTRKSNAEKGLEAARKAHKSAYDAGDSDGMLKAAEDIAEFKAEMKMLDNQQPIVQPTPQQPTSKVEEVKQQPAPTEQPVSQPDPRALRWAQDNSWFGTDVAKTGAAYAIDAALKMEGYNPSSEDYYSELDRRLAESFPGREEARPKQRVAGVTKAPTAPKKVRMNQSQIAMARKLGVPLEEYAKFVRNDNDQ